ncbi:MAG: NAD(P)/FAD-dependent oxidoreductase [Woeseiaceae bacterium]|nr:NAD(P)/FAD-dependent oxidoreductase [Woeseiaceae bacterium]
MSLATSATLLEGKLLLVDYDSIIIGAGHNGLVCAAYLAKSGQRVLVLEAADRPGGLAANRDLGDGFQVPIAHTMRPFPAPISRDLELARHGYRPATTSLPTVGFGRDGEPVVLRGDSAGGVGEADAAACEKLTGILGRFATALAPFWLKTMPRLGNTGFGEAMTFGQLGLNLRRMGKANFYEFLRMASLPVRDLMDETFDNDTLKATLAWDGLIGSKMAPRSPNGAVLAMLYRRAGNAAGQHDLPEGGAGALVDALAAAVTAAGGEIRCGTPVRRVLTEQAGDAGLAANGVELESGDVITAGRVVSSADPKTTFLDLVGVQTLDIGFANRIRRLRSDGYVGKLHLALDAAPEFTGFESADGRMIIAPDMDAIEFAFDDAKYGELPAEPVMEVVVPSLHDASLAPEGRHVLSAHVMYVPYRLKGGWTDDARTTIRDRAIEAIARHAPRLREQVVHAEFLAPADLERDYRVTGGHWHHTEFAIDQMLMMRPTYEAAQYRTPIPGLMLCGAGCHPGGDLTGAAGHNAARELLR